MSAAPMIGFRLDSFTLGFYDQSMNDDYSVGETILTKLFSHVTFVAQNVPNDYAKIKRWHVWVGKNYDETQIKFYFEDIIYGYDGYEAFEQAYNEVTHIFSRAQITQVGNYFRNRTTLDLHISADSVEYESNGEWTSAGAATVGAMKTIQTTPLIEDSCAFTLNGVSNPTLLMVNGGVTVEKPTFSISFSNEMGTCTFTGTVSNSTDGSSPTINAWNYQEYDLSESIALQTNNRTIKLEWANGNPNKRYEYYVIAPFLRLNGYNELFLYSSEEPLVVSSSGATFSQEITAKAVVNTTLYNVSDFNVDRNISYNNAKNSSGGIYVTHPTATFVFTNDRGTSTTFQNVEGTIKIYVEITKPKSIVISGTDSNTYFAGRTCLFKTPSGLTYKFKYNDGTEVNYNSEELHYKLSSDPNDDDLVADVSEIPPTATNIYVHCTLTFDGVDYPIYGSYNIQRVVDEILDLRLDSISDITLGNPLKNSDLTITAIYDSGEEITFEDDDFVITSPTGILMEEFTSISVRVVNSNFTKTFSSSDLSDLTYQVSAPTIGVITANNLVTGYNNQISQIDLTNTTLTIHYTNAEYTNDVTLGAAYSSALYSVVAQIISGGVATNMFQSETIDNYNGTNYVSVSSLQTGSADCQFVFTVKSKFDSSTKTLVVPFIVLAMTEIKGIKINNAFTEYRVGDHFLERDDDNTEVVVYWEENSILYYRSLPLKSGYSAISVYPQIGTELKNIENSKQVQVKSVLNSSVSAEYQIKVLPKSIESDSNTLDLVPVWRQNVQCPNGEIISPENGKGVLILVKRSDVNIGLNNIYELKSENVKVYGYIKDILDEDRYAVTVLFDDYLPPIRSAANCEITFPSYEEGEADLINKCTFGTLFGANNSVNRLFVSGNPDIGNADWHTSALNLTDYEGPELLSINGNFSYFASAGVMYYGESDNKVVGYDIISDDKLLVLKTKSDKEKTVYFRTPLTLKAVDATGSVSTDQAGASMTMEEFGLIKGNNSVAGVSPFSICNFNGDTLFVDADNQVSGLDLTGIVGDRQRYANSRSKYIDYRLKDLDLSNATLWNNNKYLYLSIPNVGLFVSHFEAKEANQYDWWFLTSDNPKVFLDYNDKVYFGNDDGTLGVLENGTQKDIRKVFADADQTTLVSILPAEERVLLTNDIINKLSADKDYAFRVIPSSDYRHNIYYEVARAYANNANADIKIDWENDTIVGGRFQEGKTYYLNCIEEDLVNSVEIDVDQDSIIAEFGRKFKLKQVGVDDEEYNAELPSYYLIDEESGLRITNFSTIEFNEVSICELLNEDVEVGDIDFVRNTISLRKDGEVINVITYGLQNPSERTIKAEIREYDGVEAYYITAPFFANTLNTFKTIWQITLTNDTDIASSLKVGVASNKVPFYDSKDLAHTARGDLGINLNSMDFSKTDFDKKVVPRTYTMNRVLGMQKFLCLAFKNEKGNNAVLSEMAITYTLPFPSYGSD